MAETPPTVKGMNDILAPEIAKWQFVEERARMVLDAFAFRELRTPALEYTALFQRSVGEATDVVEKQMYTFDDRDGRSVSLRPEGTASAVRAYVAAARWHVEPVTRWYYLGPMFRHERAQRGRLRQFHQLGAEVFGAPAPGADAELIGMLVALLRELGLPAGGIDVVINTLGQPAERAAYRDALQAYLRAHRDGLDEDARRRVETNPLRVLDSKNEAVQAICARAPRLEEHLGAASRAEFARVQELLAGLGVTPTVNPLLVRGLDYYTGVIFEIQARGDLGNLGAQNTLVGGGRYDGLVEELGGPTIPAIGFAMGMERLLLALPEPADTYQAPVSLYVAPLGARAHAWALAEAQRLRLGGLRVELDHRHDQGLKAQLKRADKLGARLALIVGDQELDRGALALKDLATKEQHEVAPAALEAKLRALLD